MTDTKWKCPGKAKRILSRVKALIFEEPKRLDMDQWGFRSSDSAPACGTVACIAGWADLVAAPALETGLKRAWSPDGKKRLRGEVFLPRNVPGKASKLLGLREELTSRMFYVGYWPFQFWTRHASAKTPRQRAKVTCERIDHFIANGE